MRLESIPTRALAARRARLAERLRGQPALLAAGAPAPRNYAANTYPFRASSHLLYFMGWAAPGAWAYFDGAEWALYTEPHGLDHALWHGPSPSFEALARAVGCEVRAVDGLAAALAGNAVATLPAVDALTRQEQGRMLGRDLAALGERDVRLAEEVIALRLVHDEAAVQGLREAVAITVRCHAEGMRATRGARSESELRAAMEAPMLAADGAPAYGSIVTVHGEVLHSDRYANPLRSGDLVLADVGAEGPSGWASDVTRTWPVSGAFSGPQRALYEVVLRAQLDAIAQVRPGVRYRDVHLTACRALTRGLVDLGILRGDPEELVADGVHALFFPHGVGHLLGLDVHDMEDLGDRAGYAPGRTRSAQFGLGYLRLDRDLVPGMAVTIEPGFYQVPALLESSELAEKAGDRLNRSKLAAFADVRGIRIEDDVLVTATGNEVLTAAIPKQPSDVEQAVGAG